jgi:hypothetical protein
MRERFSHSGSGQCVSVIDVAKLILLHQRQRCQAKECMENICLVARSVCDTATASICLQVLTVEDISP